MSKSFADDIRGLGQHGGVVWHHVEPAPPRTRIPGHRSVVPVSFLVAAPGVLLLVAGGVRVRNRWFAESRTRHRVGALRRRATRSQQPTPRSPLASCKPPRSLERRWHETASLRMQRRLALSSDGIPKTPRAYSTGRVGCRGSRSRGRREHVARGARVELHANLQVWSLARPGPRPAADAWRIVPTLNPELRCHAQRSPSQVRPSLDTWRRPSPRCTPPRAGRGRARGGSGCAGMPIPGRAGGGHVLMVPMEGGGRRWVGGSPSRSREAPRPVRSRWRRPARWTLLLEARSAVVRCSRRKRIARKRPTPSDGADRVVTRNYPTRRGSRSRRPSRRSRDRSPQRTAPDSPESRASGPRFRRRIDAEIELVLLCRGAPLIRHREGDVEQHLRARRALVEHPVVVLGGLLAL